MKKLLFSCLCAAAFLTACNSEELAVINDSGSDLISDGQARYLSVNIVSNTDGTKAAAGDVVPGEPGDAKYEKGLDKENAVTSVRFYFFDSDGDPAYVKSGQEVNYYDWTEGISVATPGDNMPNVEKILNATIVISTKEGDTFPSQMLAVVNPRKDLGDESRSLGSLRTVTADYALHANGDGKSDSDYPGNYFPMCNSVYAEVNGEIVKATKITTDKYKSTVDAATTDPVQIYVERNVAKVRTSLDFISSMKMEGDLIKLQSKDADGNVSDIELPQTDIIDNPNTTTENTAVYLKLLGWNVTADMNVATLSKRLKDPVWSSTELGFTWNNPGYRRSYWANQLSNSVSRYGDFNAAQAKSFTTNNYTYCNENTIAQGNADYQKRNTKIIIAGTLCDKGGKALTICEYYGIKFIDDKDQTNLKKSVLNYLTNNGENNYYKRIGNVVSSIAPEDITFKYAKTATATDSKGLYFVVPILTEDAKKYDWYTTKNAEEGSEHESSDIDEDLQKSQHAKIWNTGMTYYYADINHFGTDKVGEQVVARKGVVRNHIYDMSINSIYGLGTPVWDPEKEIIPEKTEEEDTFIGAQINILSWRIVNNSVSINWGN
ncbi:MAG: Mfa1 family fimbria major subunit [Paraprevotella sp.]|nr:Mfa1 family fimbria major subunit [Paraprevotella sp.]